MAGPNSIALRSARPDDQNDNKFRPPQCRYNCSQGICAWLNVARPMAASSTTQSQYSANCQSPFVGINRQWIWRCSSRWCHHDRSNACRIAAGSTSPLPVGRRAMDRHGSGTAVGRMAILSMIFSRGVSCALFWLVIAGQVKMGGFTPSAVASSGERVPDSSRTAPIRGTAGVYWALSSQLVGVAVAGCAGRPTPVAKVDGTTGFA